MNNIEKEARSSVEERIELLEKLGNYMLSDEEEWLNIQEAASYANSWFTPAHVSMAIKNIAEQYLDGEKLKQWVKNYNLPASPRTVGIVMAGNIPLVGFHDMLCGFVSGHNMILKTSSKDEILIRHLIAKLIEWQPNIAEQIKIADTLNGCDAYIATGSNNTARYFEQYFGKYPNIIRRNRTSVAVLDGTETEEELDELAEDIFLYFGLGCRNVTQVCLPRNYDIPKLLEAFARHEDMAYYHKYKHNYDYYLAIYLLNKVPYYTNNSLLMVENNVPFSAVSVLHYRYYDDKEGLLHELQNSADIQCIEGHGMTPFGNAQKPSLSDYADGVDTMAFLCKI